MTSVSSARVSVLIPPASSMAWRRKAPTAPGTQVMQRSTSSSRRSRLNPTTYSRCCHRPSSPLRFPTLTLPETAPTRGWRSGWTSRRIVWGSKTVSPSSMTRTSYADSSVPVRRAAAFPALGWLITRTRVRPSPRTMSAVPSVEPSSMTRISRSPG